MIWLSGKKNKNYTNLLLTGYECKPVKRGLLFWTEEIITGWVNVSDGLLQNGDSTLDLIFWPSFSEMDSRGEYSNKCRTFEGCSLRLSYFSWQSNYMVILDKTKATWTVEVLSLYVKIYSSLTSYFNLSAKWLVRLSHYFKIC